MYFYHYYDSTLGPFRNISDHDRETARHILETIRRTRPDSFCSKRQETYPDDRAYYERILREEFLKKGGKPVRQAPHYMVVGHCPWLASWYENSAFIRIPAEEFDPDTLSFTYGDSHPTFSDKVNDGKEYRKKLYRYDEILEVIDKYGLPQDWNSDGRFGPERYVEVHVWSDETISRYIGKKP